MDNTPLLIEFLKLEDGRLLGLPIKKRSRQEKKRLRSGDVGNGKTEVNYYRVTQVLFGLIDIKTLDTARALIIPFHNCV